MKNTLKDVFYVSSIVDYITDLHKLDQSSHKTSSKSQVTTTTHSSRPILTNRVKKSLKQIATKYFNTFQDKLNDVDVYDSYNGTVICLEKRLLKYDFSTMEFLKYCCQVCALASHAIRLGLKPSARLAEFYILHTIKKFRSKAQFENDNWRYMDDIIVERLSDYGVLN